MFRAHPDCRQPEKETFNRVRHALEPTLYALRYEMLFIEADVVANRPGSVYPIPYYFDPLTGNRLKAWQRGSLIIDHMSLGHENIVTVDVMAYAEGQQGDVLHTEDYDLGGLAADPLTLKRFYFEVAAQNLAEYEALALVYSLDAPAAMTFAFSTQLLWRPSV